MKKWWKSILATTLACSLFLAPTTAAALIVFMPGSDVPVIIDETSSPVQFTHEDVLVTELPSNVVSAGAVHEGYISITRNLGEWGTYSRYTDGFLTATPEEYESLFGHPMDYSKFTEIVYEEYLTDDFRSGFIDVYGNELFPFSAAYSYGDLSEGLTQAYQRDTYDDALGLMGGMLCGYANTSGELVIPVKYYMASDFENGYASVRYFDDAGQRQDEIIDKNGNTVLSGYQIETYQTTEPCVISKDGKYGLASYDGTIIIEPTYDLICQYLVGTFINGLAEVNIGDKSGYINMQGELVFDVIYDDTWFFSEDKIWVGQDGYYAIVNSSGQQLTDYVYEKYIESAPPLNIKKIGYIDQNGTAFAKLGENYVYLNEDLEIVHSSTYNNGYSGAEKYMVDADGTVTYYPLVDGEYLAPLTYNESGLYRSYEPYISYSYHKENPQKYGFIDENHDTIMPFLYTNVSTYDDIDAFSEGYAVVMYNDSLCIIQNPLDIIPTASPTTSTVLVDGTNTPFEAYNIADNNYFKLRDIAQILSGTQAQFEVTWDGDKQAINLVSCQGYTSVGGELATGNGTAKEYLANTSTIYLDGVAVNLTAYTINDNNYFKLRDLGEALGFNVSWDSSAQTIVIASDEAYTAD